MWLSRQLNQDKESGFSETGQVTISSGNIFAVCGSMENRSFKIFSPYGISSLPPEGQQALLLNGTGGGYCVGFQNQTMGLEPGEVRISSLGGSYIHLRNNGEVDINGLVITSEGTIKSVQQQKTTENRRDRMEE